MLERIETYFSSWRFPSFMLATLLFSWILIMVMAFIPVSDTAWGAFAEDFKVWCFGYDPETGSMQWIYLIMFTVNPLIMSFVIFFVWSEPFREVLTNPLIIKTQASLAMILVVVVSASFLLMYEVPKESEPEFRPDALRISLTPPRFSLTNHREEPVSLGDFEGRVVVVTSIYASCADTCPMILEQVKHILDDLSPEERDDVVLLAITMQPEKDTPDLLSKVARFYKLNRYNAHLLTGDPEDVNSVLDRLNFSRFKEENSADIDHANLFLVIDRSGSVAYRFTLGERQRDWMTRALKLLVQEDRNEMVFR